MNLTRVPRILLVASTNLLGRASTDGDLLAGSSAAGLAEAL